MVGRRDTKNESRRLPENEEERTIMWHKEKEREGNRQTEQNIGKKRERGDK